MADATPRGEVEASNAVTPILIGRPVASKGVLRVRGIEPAPAGSTMATCQISDTPPSYAVAVPIAN